MMLKGQFLKLVVTVVIAAGSGLTACANNPQTPVQSPTASNTTENSSPAIDHSSMDHAAMDHSTMHGMGMDLGPADAEYNLRFIDAMIPHHQGAVEMAKQAKEKSKRPEIQKLADDIIKAQDKEIAQMKQWRTAWYPKATAEPVAYNAKTGKSAAMTPDQMQTMMMNQDLGTADAEFDLRFIDAMIRHHQGAVTMAKDALTKTKQPEIKSLAQDIIRSQEGEIQQMQQWKKAWYKQ